ncbi:MAG: DUF4249 domain-containing protein [Prolixibacteraceae bacterium]|jgi:hypothetical protein|nr:DUF4249 domain-containing protein [Prolixibacteraceae bacterium]
MNILKNLFFILLMGCFFSCTQEIEISLPPQQSSLVVYSTLVPFTLPIPKSLYINIGDTRQMNDTTNNNVSNAQVLLKCNGSITDTLNYNSSLGYYPINSFYPKQGDSLSVEVDCDGYEKVYANTVVPSKVCITDTVITPIAFFDETGSAFSELAVSFIDPADEINYYELAITQVTYSYNTPDNYYRLRTNDNIIISESYYPSKLHIDAKSPRSLLFSDQSFNGESRTFKVYYTPPQRESEERYISPHYISVHLRNVTEAYYRFKTSFLHHSYNNIENILYGMGEPINVESNVENGFGLFAAFNNDIVTLRVEEQVINNK